MTRILEYKILEKSDEVTIKEFLKKREFPSKILSLLKRVENGITVNGIHKFVTYKLTLGDVLKVIVAEERPSENIVMRDIPIDILYEDYDILILNKSAGIAVHPSQGHFSNSLANGVMNYYGEDFVIRIINRLDKDTSGVLIFAKNRISAAILTEMIKKHEIKREYLAICKGDLTNESGKINAPIARVSDSTIERSVCFDTGKEAITNYKKIAYRNGHSLVSINLETGRTHQIRVHMKYIGFPLIGDFLYNEDYEMIKRQALHSKSLEFLHPITKELLYFEAPLPQDMAQIMED